jgi:hypothetical protein
MVSTRPLAAGWSWEPDVAPSPWPLPIFSARLPRSSRSIVEEALLEVMYDIPERTDIRKCIITEETIRDGRLPLLLTKSDVDSGVDETNYADWLAERGESA